VRFYPYLLDVCRNVAKHHLTRVPEVANKAEDNLQNKRRAGIMSIMLFPKHRSRQRDRGQTLHPLFTYFKFKLTHAMHCCR
jgi:hypothetical protein